MDSEEVLLLELRELDSQLKSVGDLQQMLNSDDSFSLADSEVFLSYYRIMVKGQDWISRKNQYAPEMHIPGGIPIWMDHIDSEIGQYERILNRKLMNK